MSFDARYAGTCVRCSQPIKVGQRIRGAGKNKRGYTHTGCEHEPALTTADRDNEPEMFEDKQRRIDNREYAKGRAEGKRYSSDVKIYGQAQADAWEMEAEMARYNRGEDY